MRNNSSLQTLLPDNSISNYMSAVINVVAFCNTFNRDKKKRTERDFSVFILPAETNRFVTMPDRLILARFARCPRVLGRGGEDEERTTERQRKSAALLLAGRFFVSM